MTFGFRPPGASRASLTWGGRPIKIPWQAEGRLARSFYCGYGVLSCTAINFSYFITPSNITNNPNSTRTEACLSIYARRIREAIPIHDPRDSSHFFHLPARCIHDFTTFQLSRNFNCTLLTLVFLTHTCSPGHHVAKRTTMGPGSLFRLLYRRYRH